MCSFCERELSVTAAVAFGAGRCCACCPLCACCCCLCCRGCCLCDWWGDGWKGLGDGRGGMSKATAVGDLSFSPGLDSCWTDDDTAGFTVARSSRLVAGGSDEEDSTSPVRLPDGSGRGGCTSITAAGAGGTLSITAAGIGGTGGGGSAPSAAKSASSEKLKPERWSDCSCSNSMGGARRSRGAALEWRSTTPCIASPSAIELPGSEQDAPPDAPHRVRPLTERASLLESVAWDAGGSKAEAGVRARSDGDDGADKGG